MVLGKLKAWTYIAVVGGLVVVSAFLASYVGRDAPDSAIAIANPAQSASTYNEAGIDAAAVFPRGIPEMCKRLGSHYWLPPSDQLLARAQPQPPIPLFAEYFIGLARSAIAAKWLPPSFDDAKYLEIGEGAYRAFTARLCKIYTCKGTRVILQGFVGRLVLMVEPLPVQFPPETEALLREARSLTDSKGYYPYLDAKEGVPPAIESMFASIVDEILTTGVHPANKEEWKRRIKAVCVLYGRLYLSYVPKKIKDLPTVSLWTNGRVLIVRVDSADPTYTKLFEALQPTLKVPIKPLPGIAKVVTKNEWTDSQQHLVPTQAEATHQWFYFRIAGAKDGRYRAWINLTKKYKQLETAQWASLAMDTLEEIINSNYQGWQVVRLAQTKSRREALSWLKKRRDRCLKALDSLKGYRCPDELQAARKAVLAAVKPVAAIWDIAWPRWQKFLSQPEDVVVDYESVEAAIRQRIIPTYPDAGMNTFSTGLDIIREALDKMGMWVDEAIYERI